MILGGVWVAQVCLISPQTPYIHIYRYELDKDYIFQAAYPFIISGDIDFDI